MDKYNVEFTIPRDLELISKAFKLNNKNQDFEVTISIIERLITIPGIDSKNTTACFHSNEDRFGDTVKTRFLAEFELKKDIFNDSFEEKKDGNYTKEYMDDWMAGKRHNFIYTNILLLVNQLIEIHQYVNNKYFVFPIDERSIFDLNVIINDKPIIICNNFGGGYFSNDHDQYEKELQENTHRVNDFINNRLQFFEPIRTMKYALEFYKMGLYRIAITEAQSSIEHLLEIRIKEATGNTFKDTDKLRTKLTKFSKKYLFKINKQDNGKLGGAIELRNDIIHGKNTPNLNSVLCKEYITIYDRLFLVILNSKKRTTT